MEFSVNETRQIAEVSLDRCELIGDARYPDQTQGESCEDFIPGVPPPNFCAFGFLDEENGNPNVGFDNFCFFFQYACKLDSDVLVSMRVFNETLMPPDNQPCSEIDPAKVLDVRRAGLSPRHIYITLHIYIALHKSTYSYHNFYSEN